MNILYNTHNIHTHNTNKTTIWQIYNNTTALYYLIKSLNIHIECEKSLISAIQARFIIEEVEPLSSQEPCLTEGSEYIGRQVKRAFGKTVSIYIHMYHVYNMYYMRVYMYHMRNLLPIDMYVCMCVCVYYVYYTSIDHLYNLHAFTPNYTVCTI